MKIKVLALTAGVLAGAIRVPGPLAATTVTAQPPAAEPQVALLIHGLFGSAGSWKEAAADFRQAGWQEGCRIVFPANETLPRPEYAPPDDAPKVTTYIGGECPGIEKRPDGRYLFRVEFEDSSGQTLEMQGEQVRVAAVLARRWTGASTVSLIGHSMGGLAARAYLQSSEYKNDVDTLISVATPHAGSLHVLLKDDCAALETCLPFVLRRGLPKLSYIAGKIGSWKCERLSRVAIDELAPGAPALTRLSRKPLPGGVRYVSVISLMEGAADDSTSCLRYKSWFRSFEERLGNEWDEMGRLWTRHLAANLQRSEEILMNGSDGVVPAISQYMKVIPAARETPVEVRFIDGFHTDATDSGPLLLEILASRPEAAPRTGDLSLALVLDSSGSMRDNDPGGLRRQGAELLIDSTPPSTLLTVVDFDGSARVPVARSTDRATVSGAIAATDSSGGTSTCAGLTAAARELSAAEGVRSAAILFTDGISNDRCGEELFRQKGWPIYTVGLSVQADGEYLQKVALETGGAYLHAVGPGDLQQIFDIVASELLAEATLVDVVGTVQKGQTAVVPVFVDESCADVRGTLIWPGSDLDLTLVSPSGRRFAARPNPGGSSTWEALRLEDPEPGRWLAEILGIDVSPEGESYRLRMVADSPMRPILSLGTPTVSAGGTVEFQLRLEGFPARPAPRVVATVKGPDGAVRPAEVSEGPDGWAATYRATQSPGPYTIQLVATTGEISRVGARSFFVTGSGRSGGAVRVKKVIGEWVLYLNVGSLGGAEGGQVYDILDDSGSVIGSCKLTTVFSTQSAAVVLDPSPAIQGGSEARVQERFLATPARSD